MHGYVSVIFGVLDRAGKIHGCNFFTPVFLCLTLRKGCFSYNGDMRIYIPLCVSDFSREALFPRPVHGVTHELRRVFPRADEEGLEYAATMSAADDSLRRLSAADRVLRRTVAVAEVPGKILALPASAGSNVPSVLLLREELPWNCVESLLVDEPGNESLVRRALNGDENAFLLTGEIELLWYDISERALLREELNPPA